MTHLWNASNLFAKNCLIHFFSLKNRVVSFKILLLFGWWWINVFFWLVLFSIPCECWFFCCCWNWMCFFSIVLKWPLFVVSFAQCGATSNMMHIQWIIFTWLFHRFIQFNHVQFMLIRERFFFFVSYTHPKRVKQICSVYSFSFIYNIYVYTMFGASCFFSHT